MTTIRTTNDRIKVASHKHEALMLHLCENPTERLGVTARVFDVTPAWLSTMIHSEIFQDRFVTFREEYMGIHMQELGDKLNALAHQSLDALMDKVDDSDDPSFLASVAGGALDRLGYGSKPAATTIVNHGTMAISPASAGALKNAESMRARLREEKDVSPQTKELPNAQT